jgi:kynurenine formamidase
MHRVIDLSHTLADDMPVYPGTQPPVIRPAHTIERNGFAETSLALYSHVGTHMDAPSHMLAGAPSLDSLDVSHFVGEGCVIDATGCGGTIPLETVRASEDEISKVSFVLLRSGWDRYWGESRYFSGFPILSDEAAGWLACRGLKGIGFDALSADAVEAETFVNHQHFFRAGMVIVENLRGLEPLVGRRFVFACLPLKFANADGSPVRAVALLGGVPGVAAFVGT